MSNDQENGGKQLGEPDWEVAMLDLLYYWRDQLREIDPWSQPDRE